MGDLPFDLARDEYAALRATIRERGSLRVVLFVTAMGIWGALLVTTAALLSFPAAGLVPLLMLAAGFEAVASLHLGVERIGRYVQVRFEGDDAPLPTWERTAMAWGRQYPGTGTDPLFATVFSLSAALNYVPIALTGVPVELIAFGLAHAAFLWRVWRVRAWAGRQRAEDLARYRQLLETRPTA